jgi:hypothetical protein
LRSIAPANAPVTWSRSTTRERIHGSKPTCRFLPPAFASYIAASDSLSSCSVAFSEVPNVTPALADKAIE